MSGPIPQLSETATAMCPPVAKESRHGADSTGDDARPDSAAEVDGSNSTAWISFSTMPHINIEIIRDERKRSPTRSRQRLRGRIRGRTRLVSIALRWALLQRLN